MRTAPQICQSISSGVAVFVRRAASPARHKLWLLFFIALATVVSLLARQAGSTPALAANPAEMASASAMPFAPVIHCVPNVSVDFTCHDAFGTVQDAINHANNGDTILIGPGVFIEQVLISKNLTIKGAGVGATAILAPDPLVADSFGPNVFVVVEIGNGATVSISNLTVSGPGPLGCGLIEFGVFVVGNATLSLDQAAVTHIRDTPFGGCQNGLGIGIGRGPFSQVGHATITNTTISDYQKEGILVDGPGSTAVIMNNTITGAGVTPAIAQNGIQVSRGAVATIDNNNISGNEYSGPGSGPDPVNNVQSTGILLFDVGDGNGGAGDGTVVENNIISNNDIGIANQATGTYDVNNNTLSNNRFEGIFTDEGTLNLNKNSITGGNFGLFVLSFTGATGNTLAVLNGNTFSGVGNNIQTLDQPGNNNFAALIMNVTCTAPPAGLVSWYPGDGTAQDYVGSNNGVAVGGLTYVPGEVGDSFKLNGTDGGVVVPDAASLNFGPSASPNSSFTIDAWIKVAATSVKPVISIVDKRDITTNSGALGYVLFLLNGRLDVQLAASGSGFTNYPAAGPDLRDGNFHLVAVTVNRGVSGGGTLYVDGAAVGTFDPTDQAGDLTNSRPLLIGLHQDPNQGASLPGSIDEVEIFNRALSSSEINSIFNASIAGKCKIGSLSITKTHTPSPFTVGQDGTYSLSVTNTGTVRTLDPTVVLDTLPTGMSLLNTSGSDAGWNCSGTTTLNCSNNNVLLLNQTSTLKLQVGVTQAGPAINSASAFGPFGSVMTSAPDTQTVNKGTPAFSNLSSANVNFGQTPSLGGTIKLVTPDFGTLIPTGNVSIMIGSITVNTLVQPDGTFSANFPTNLLGPGVFPINYVYAGDSNFNSISDSSQTITLHVVTNLVLTASSSASQNGVVVTFTAQILDVPPLPTNMPMPTGTIIFKEGSTTLATRVVNGTGSASFSTSSLGSGQHTIVAIYSGDSSFLGSTSNTKTEFIGLGDLDVNQSTGQDPVMVGDTLNFGMQISSGGPQTAINVVYHDVTPPGTYFASISVPSGVTCTKPAVGGTGAITCQFGNFSPGHVANFTISFFVDPGNLTTIAHTASVSSDTIDQFMPNNTTTRNVAVTMVTGLSASSLPAGSLKSVLLTVSGSNFKVGSTVQVNGITRSTTFLNSKQLRVVIAPSDMAKPGTLAVTVSVPGMTRLSNAKTLQIVGAAGRITRVVTTPTVTKATTTTTAGGKLR